MRLLLGLVLVCRVVSAQTVIYVDTDAAGANNGTNWIDAFLDLQDALATATSGDEIWVAEGLYKPTRGSDRTISFDVISSVALYGGFNGTEATRDERDWALHETILSGDVGVSGDSLDNSFHVISAASASATTIVDGVIVRRGRANGAPPFDLGGGLYAPNSDLTVRNTVFRWNAAIIGGAVYFENGSPIVEDCLFDSNVGSGAIFDSGGNPVLRRFTVTRNVGGGLIFFDGSTATAEDCVVELGFDFGMLMRESSPTFHRCTFRQNFDGGGAVIADGSSPVFEDCLFEGNQAAVGAGVSVEGNSVPLFIRTTFRENVATSTGGAVNSTLSAPTFIDCVFERNTGLGAGAIRAASSSVTLVSSVLAGNISTIETGDVGGLQLAGSTWQGMPSIVVNSLFVGNEGASGGALLAVGIDPGDARIVNSTFVGNLARENGGAVYAFLADGLEFNNVILWGNEAPNDSEIHVDQGGPPIVERAIIAGGYPSGTDVLDQDPLFVRPPNPGPDGNWGTDDDDYGDLRLLEDSPAIDFGLTSFLPADIWDLDGDGNTTEPLPVDLNGDVRVQGGSVDLGAYEGPGVVAGELDVPEPHELRLRVYPNPAAEHVTIEGHDDSEIVIFDVLGRRVLAIQSDLHSLTIDISELPPGIYAIRSGIQSRLITVRRSR